MREVKKTILVLSPFFSPNLGGVETHLDDLAAHLTDSGYRVFVLTYQPLAALVKGKSLEKKSNLEIHRFNWFGANLFFRFERLPPVFNFLYLSAYLGLRSFVFLLSNKDKIDLIHAFGLNAAFIARCLKFVFRKKIIVSTEALYGYKKGTFFANVCSWVLKGFDVILAQSEASREEMISIGVPREKIEVFAHWVNQQRFRPDDKEKLKRKLGWDNKFTILFLGRLIKAKGINLVLEVAQKSKKEIAFKIIGDDGPELKTVKQAQARLNNLEYIGPVVNQRLPIYYGAADLFLYPALYTEDMSRAILESLSCGTPVISTNRGSGIYALDDSVAVITRPEVSEVAETINFLYENPQKVTEMNRNCPSFSKKFGSQSARIITDTYNKL